MMFFPIFDFFIIYVYFYSLCRINKWINLINESTPNLFYNDEQNYKTSIFIISEFYRLFTRRILEIGNMYYFFKYFCFPNKIL